MKEERYLECDRCDERFVGENAIRAYLVQTPDGRVLCRRCCREKTRKRRPKYRA